MNRKFLGQLKIVHQDFIEMGLEAAEAIKLATEAFENHDLELANKVIEHDEVINNLEINLTQNVHNPSVYYVSETKERLWQQKPFWAKARQLLHRL